MLVRVQQKQIGEGLREGVLYISSTALTSALACADMVCYEHQATIALMCRYVVHATACTPCTFVQR